MRLIFLVIDLINDKNENNIFYEISFEYIFNYNIFRYIDQKNEYQIIKSSIKYKKFVNYRERDVLINYENEYIYRLINLKK